MKIALIGHKRIPSREGGIEICVEELAVSLVRAGHEVSVYNRKKKGFTQLKDYKGARIINIPTINKKSLDAPVYSLFAVIHALFGFYDIIHFHALGPSVMAFIPKIFGYKVVCTIHGLDWQRTKWSSFAKNYLLLGEWIAATYADALIVLSNNMKQYFKDRYFRDSQFIPNGIASPIIRETNIIREKYGLQKNSYLLFLARIVPEKGLHYLIKAFRSINTDLKLVISGGESHTTEYFRKIKDMADLDNRIIMTGFVQGVELDELFSNALLYILPSEIEGMPLSLLEAMGYGNCCVVSDIPEITEVTKDSAIIFESGNIQSLKNAIISVINDIEKINSYRKAAAKIIENYTWENMVNSTVALYENVLM